MFIIIFAYAVAAALQEGQCGAKQQPMVRVHLLTHRTVFLACATSKSTNTRDLIESAFFNAMGNARVKRERINKMLNICISLENLVQIIKLTRINATHKHDVSSKCNVTTRDMVSDRHHIHIRRRFQTEPMA